jgi:vacuolar-type H+-ATPase subunit F/Vma7
VGTVAVIGEQVLIQGFALAGAVVLPAENATAACAAWLQLPRNVLVVVLTPAAAAALGDLAHADGCPATVVMPP